MASPPAITGYRHIAADLRRRITNGQWVVGDQIPSRRDLAEQYQVATTTIERAVALLLQEGVLRAERGRRGTVVADHIGASTASPSIFSPADSLRAFPASHSPVSTVSADITAGVIYETLEYEISDPLERYYASWESLVVQGFERTFSSLGGHHLAVNAALPVTSDHDERTRLACEALQQAGVHMVLMCGLYARGDHRDAKLRHLRRMQIPYLYISNTSLADPIPHLMHDEQIAGYLAAQHLLAQGYRHLIFFAPFFEEWITGRLNGARQAVAAAQLPAHHLRVYPDHPFGRWVYTHDSTVDIDMTAALITQGIGNGTIFNGDDAPGIISMNDTTALQIQQVMQSAGKHAGEDYGLIGFDDCPGARATGMSTVRPPFENTGDLAARFLWHAAHGAPLAMQTRLAPELIQRASTTRALPPSLRMTSHQHAAMQQVTTAREAG